MAENRGEVLAGAAVVAAAIGFLVFAFGATGLSSGSATYALKASFRSVEGITAGSDVRLAGVKIGSITALTLSPQTFYADVSLAINSAISLPQDSSILISSEGLLGGNFVEIQPGGAIETLSAGDEIEDTQGAVSLISLLMKFVSSSGNTPEPSAP